MRRFVRSGVGKSNTTHYLTIPRPRRERSEKNTAHPAFDGTAPGELPAFRLRFGYPESTSSYPLSAATSRF